MLVNSLLEMEKIVDSREDLDWHGWDVVRYFNNGSIMSKDSVFINNKWLKRKIYPVKEDGWNVPDSFGGSLA